MLRPTSGDKMEHKSQSFNDIDSIVLVVLVVLGLEPIVPVSSRNLNRILILEELELELELELFPIDTPVNTFNTRYVPIPLSLSLPPPVWALVTVCLSVTWHIDLNIFNNILNLQQSTSSTTT